MPAILCTARGRKWGAERPSGSKRSVAPVVGLRLPAESVGNGIRPSKLRCPGACAGTTPPVRWRRAAGNLVDGKVALELAALMEAGVEITGVGGSGKGGLGGAAAVELEEVLEPRVGLAGVHPLVSVPFVEERPGGGVDVLLEGTRDALDQGSAGCDEVCAGGPRGQGAGARGGGEPVEEVVEGGGFAAGLGGAAGELAQGGERTIRISDDGGAHFTHPQGIVGLAHQFTVPYVARVTLPWVST